MISNSTSNSAKLKASKTSRDYSNLHNDKITPPGSDDEAANNTDSDEVVNRVETDENADEDEHQVEQHEPGSTNNHVRFMVFSPYSKVRGLLEFRQGRGGERRTSSSTRSANKLSTYNYSRRDQLSNRKFQESLNKNDINTHSKHAYDIDKNKLETFYNNLPDDPRISKMLRKLSVENDQDKSVALCHKLLEMLMLPDNATYIRRAFGILANSLIDIISYAPCDESKHLAARALGRIGYIMENDFKFFLTWLIKEFRKNRGDEIKILLMKALIETYTLEMNNNKLFDFYETTMNQVINQVEYAERPELFMSLIDVAILIIQCYPDVADHFRDVVDILVGWLVESKHSPEMADYASRSLQRLGVHWQTNIRFSIQLLAQFLEDLVSFSEALTQNASGSSTPLDYISPKIETSLNQVTALTRVINTILKCLGPCLNPQNNTYITLQFLTDCFINIVSTATKTLDKYLPENLIIAANESAFILLEFMQSKSAHVNDFLYNLIDSELSLIQDFSDATLVSMLLLISQTIKEVSANLPIELIQKLLGPHSDILKLRTSHSVQVQCGVVTVYHSLLNLKNIPLLQEAYRHVLGDLERAYTTLIPDIDPFSINNPMLSISYDQENDAEIITLFLLRCLADLANASSSIIGMWALRPSILELLAVKLVPYNPHLSLDNPSLHYSIIYLLYSHCKRYNHFVSSSNLVCTTSTNVCDLLGLPLHINLGEGATSSPTSGHLTIILDVLTRSLSMKSNVESKCLILAWACEIISLSEPFHDKLYDKTPFVDFLRSVVQCGYDLSDEVAFGVNETLKVLLSISQGKWDCEFFTQIADLCALHLNSSHAQLRSAYAQLSVKLPWHVVMNTFGNQRQMSEIKRKFKNQLGGYNGEVVALAQHLHTGRGNYAEIQTQHFKKFMAYLLFGFEHETNWLEHLLSSCWPLEVVEGDDYAKNFGLLASHSREVLIFWVTWEAAQFCVNNKLRTPLGKPTDTFTSIESTIKKLAREVALVAPSNSVIEETPTNSLYSMLNESKRVNILLEFIEHLEKVIYNAAEGCATAMVQPSKPVRTFFHTNASTCKEWFNRIRIAVVVIALHAGQSTTAIRHGQALLNDLALSDNTKGPDFERIVMYLAWAYLNLHETEALQGLYVWSSSVCGRKFTWLKAAAEQANNKFESAAKAYEHFLELQSQQNNQETVEEVDQEKAKLDINHLVQTFINDQLVECYKSVNNWSDLKKWKQKERKILLDHQNGKTINRFSTTYTEECVDAILEFEDNDFIFMNELTKWNVGTKPNSWSSFYLLDSIDVDLFDTGMTMSQCNNQLDGTEVIDKLNRLKFTTETITQENLRNLPSEFLEKSILLNYITNGLLNSSTAKLPSNPFTMTSTSQLKNFKSSILAKTLWWTECISKINNLGTGADIPNIRLEVVRAARKETNFNLARKQIQKYFDLKKDLYAMSEASDNQWTMLESIAKTLIECESLDVTTWSLNNTRAILEAAKLLYVSHENKELALFLCAVASFGVSQRLTLPDSGYELRERGTKMLLTLAKWVQLDSNNRSSSYVTDIGNPLGRFVSLLPEIGLVEHNENDVIPAQDIAVGKLLQFGVNQCPSLAKVWFVFGSWCYRWGRKIVDHRSESGGQLSENDRVAIQRLMPIGTSLDDLQNVYQILSQTQAVTDEDDIDSNDIQTSEMIKAQLRSVTILNNAYTDHLQMLVDIWRQAQKRVYAYYELAADAYFKYLQLYSSSETVSNSGECTTITATLRLLRLIVKHALELQIVLESGLASTPTHPWKSIIPQLFSRLNHPEPYVRRRVSELLCRVAEDAPHLITFPAVVGAVEGGVNQMQLAEMSLPKDYLSQSNKNNDEANESDDEEVDDDDSEENEKDVSISNVLNSCFMAMVETLSKQAPETITQVQLLVKELRRITLLWDELWLGTLVQHNSEIIRRLTQLEQEIAKVNNNQNLTKDEKLQLVTEKHRILIKPIIFILEQLNAVTSVEAETPNEKLFQERFKDLINTVIDRLKNPSNPNKPKESWQPLKLLQNRLQQRAHKRASYTLKMSDISPILANLHDTVIAMPGLTRNSKQLVTILSVDNHVSILPTKTKPKKLIFHGSDGQTYTYLFKGLEDLHLDERIMQFLSIANTMLAKSTDGLDENVYRAKHYSVIPLGPRSGLISWVDGVTPVFALYKRWQQREAAIKSSLKQNNCESDATVAVLRPSDLFYNKLNPLLKEHGIKNVENRKEWPVGVLKQVLTELMAETPDDLLAKEFWCHSINAGGWWQTIRNYSYSVAVMSIIGYIIGLGDRHLDNVLVDLSSGEVVHIDYNVCFEKGKTLRVPEKVPFRMTANIRTALGVAGVEGIFRLACEHVLRTMKKGCETLLTLLEAFVYDPLVDWTVNGGDGGLVATAFGGVVAASATNGTRQTRRELEREVTTAMFNVRCVEMKTDWLANRSDVRRQIGVVIQNLTKWLDEHQSAKIAEEALQDLHQQMALVKEAEAHASTGNHPLFSLTSRYNSHKCTFDTYNVAKKALEDRIDECEKYKVLHANALVAIRGTQLPQWIQELNFPIEHDSHLVFDIIKEFLQNAGQTSMITQCEQSESELAQLAQQQSVLIRDCLDLMSQYAAISSNYPNSYMEKHRTVCYLKWCRILLETKSTDICRDVLTQFESIYAPETTNNPLVQQIVSFSCHLQQILNDANVKFKNTFERLTAEGIPDSPGSRLDQAYNDAKSCIKTFLANEKNASKAFECVIITALCALNKRFLMMEQAAASAGDVLADLHSMDGDWFLDEMYLMSNLVTELSSLIPIQHNKVDDNRISLVLSCLKTASNLYRGLQELNFNFHTIILPEAMKTIQTEDPTVIAIVSELNDIIVDIGYPIPKVLTQLEMHLRFMIMEMESPHSNVQALVAQLRGKYEALLHSQVSESSGDTLTPGKMLLMGFNGLFDKLNVEASSLISSFCTLDFPPCWKSVDQYRDAKGLCAPIFNERTRSVLDDIFFLKRLQTISDFFVLCGKMACAFKGVGLATVYDDSQLNKPIHRFTADYVSRQLLGVTSQIIALAVCLFVQRMGLNVTNEIEQRDISNEHKVPLDEVCRNLVDLHLKRGSFTSTTLAQASGLSSTLENAWRRREVARLLQQNVEAQRATLQRIQLQLTAHSWLHEDIIMLQPGLANMSPVIRTTFMKELKKASSSLLTMQGRLSEARELQRSLIASAEQRLKWAAGANPALNDILASFECAVNIREDRINLEQQLAVQVANTCSALVHHEALRTRTSESMTHDATFITLVKQWKQACVLIKQCNSTISPTEESLMELMPLDVDIDIKWLRKAAALISEMIATRQQQMVIQTENVNIINDILKNSIGKLKELWGTHHHLMADVRNLLKSMSKNEEYSLIGLHDYLRNYYAFSDKISLTFSLFSQSNELNIVEVEKIKSNLQEIESQTDFIYETLLEFKIPVVGQNLPNITSSLSTTLLGPFSAMAITSTSSLNTTSTTTLTTITTTSSSSSLSTSSSSSNHNNVTNSNSAVANMLGSSANGKLKRAPLLRQDTVWQSPRKMNGTNNGTNSSGRGQQRNAYAVGVWRRVRMKLEGRDPDPGRRYTLQEQVDYVIREATNLENLALLYEGWTPWV